MRPATSRSRAAVMTLVFLAVAATAVPMLPVWLRSTTVPAPATPAAATNIAVDLRDDADAGDIRAVEARYGLDLVDNSLETTGDNLMVAAVPAGRNAARLVADLRRDPRVEAAEPELRYTLPAPPGRPITAAPPGTASLFRPKGRFIPNDPRYGEQWNLRMIGAERAWGRSRGRGAVVAVIDTGVAAANGGRGKRARDFAATKFVRGYDFVHDDGDPYDDHGHGTHVAGTVAESTNNREGVAGLAFEAAVMPLKVLTAEGWGTSVDIADAIRYAADHGANVINLSLGSPLPSPVIHNAVKYAARKGVVLVCAAGNGFQEGVGYPAAHPECLAVSSVGPSGELAVYSSYGREVALAAPGGDMLTSGEPKDGILQNTIFPEGQGGRGDDYYYFQGTSMASPHVAAAAALLVAQGVRDPARVRDLLTRSAVPKPDRLKYGAGVLSADRATALAGGSESRALWKWAVYAVLATLLLTRAHGLPLPVRMALLGALYAGLFGPDTMGGFLGANSAWNLVFFSALIPFALFWELESGSGSKLVAALALGIAACLIWNLLTGLLPFTPTAFGDRALPWTVANAAFSLLLAAAAWRR